MSQLKIYSASAGSGKTYTLAGEFISLLIESPESYGNILAVTFTNKATAEMKSRIIENLHLLASPENSLTEIDQKKRENLMAHHKAKTQKSERQIASACSKALSCYLNDFSRFNISTIDSFFQKIIRSFAYEAGLPAGFNVEVEQDLILISAIDRILSNIGLPGNEELKKWILEFTQSKMESDGGWSISNELIKLGKEIFNEDLQSAGTEYEEMLLDKNTMRSYQNELKTIIGEYEKKEEELRLAVWQSIETSGLNANSLAGKSRNPLLLFDRQRYFLDEDKIQRINTLAQFCKTPHDICNSTLKAPAKADVTHSFITFVKAPLESYIHFISNNFRTYYTSLQIIKNFYALGITLDIRNTTAQLAREENLFLISDTNRLLNQIIDENDAPFIYEKIGSRYRNFMIDEFQDTSKLQWNNFKPLIMNSLSQNDDCLIVGDVKQSIYRWRNSDWQLLNHHIYNDMSSYNYQKESLKKNWRSRPNIIHFNNTLFDLAQARLKQQFDEILENLPDYDESSSNMSAQISQAYSDTVQENSDKTFSNNGYVKLQFLSDKPKENTVEDSEDETGEYDDEALIQMKESIDTLIGKGYQYSDICILVRNNKDGSTIASFLLSHTNPLPVISNDSLILGNSLAVKLVIAYLRFINDGSDQISLAQIKLMHTLFETMDSCAKDDIMAEFLEKWQNDNQLTQSILEMKGKPFIELAESIISQLPQWMVANQVIFINGMLESIRSFTINKSVNVGDFLKWWDEKGNTTAISVPENQNAIRIMTIHKSKGLEFKVVLIPYANWEIDMKRGKQSLIWCTPTAEPFNKVAPVPVPYSKKLIYTHMLNDYNREKLSRYVDNLNMLYVALTRAEEVLMIWCDKAKKIDEIKNISHLLQIITNQLITKQESNPTLQLRWNDELDIFEVGEIATLQPTGDTKKPAEGRYHKKNPFTDKLRIHLESGKMSHISGQQQVWQGELMHSIMEEIETKEDIDSVLQRFVQSGQITSDEHNQLQHLIAEKISVKPEWFNGSHRIYRENAIIHNGRKYRPDRVMILGEKAIVVDYKFGKLHSADYEKQVEKYQKLLQQMGFTQTEAYLWYFNEDRGLIKIDHRSDRLF